MPSQNSLFGLTLNFFLRFNKKKKGGSLPPSGYPPRELLIEEVPGLIVLTDWPELTWTLRPGLEFAVLQAHQSPLHNQHPLRVLQQLQLRLLRLIGYQC